MAVLVDILFLFPRPCALPSSLEFPVVSLCPLTPADPAYRTNPVVGCYSEQEYSRKYFKKFYWLFSLFLLDHLLKELMVIFIYSSTFWKFNLGVICLKPNKLETWGPKYSPAADISVSLFGSPPPPHCHAAADNQEGKKDNSVSLPEE